MCLGTLGALLAVGARFCLLHLAINAPHIAGVRWLHRSCRRAQIFRAMKASYAIVSVWLLHSRIIFRSPVVFGAPSRAVLVLTVQGPDIFPIEAH